MSIKKSDIYSPTKLTEKIQEIEKMGKENPQNKCFEYGELGNIQTIMWESNDWRGEIIEEYVYIYDEDYNLNNHIGEVFFVGLASNSLPIAKIQVGNLISSSYYEDSYFIGEFEFTVLEYYDKDTYDGAIGTGDVIRYVEKTQHSISGKYSIALGKGNTTTNDYETALGYSNISHSDDDTSSNGTIFSIGKSGGNALEIMRNGDLYVKNVGNYMGYSTKEYDDNIKPLQDMLSVPYDLFNYYNLINNSDMKFHYLTFEAATDNCIIQLYKYASGSYTPLHIEYSTDGIIWYKFESRRSNSTFTQDIYTLEKEGDCLYIRADRKYNYWVTRAYAFCGTSNFYAYGNIFSLINANTFWNENENNTISQVNYLFYRLFYQATTLLSHSTKELIVELSNTVPAANYYQDMFYGCSSLVKAPKLPATTLTSSCYTGMFTYCSSLTTAPELPALNVSNAAYYKMFCGCENLNYIKCLATSLDTNATGDWVYRVSQTGTFVKNSEMSYWQIGDSGIPNDWTVIDDAG